MEHNEKSLEHINNADRFIKTDVLAHALYYMYEMRTRVNWIGSDRGVGNTNNMTVAKNSISTSGLHFLVLQIFSFNFSVVAFCRFCEIFFATPKKITCSAMTRTRFLLVAI